MSYRRHAVVVREIDFGYRGVPFPRQRHQRRIVQQRKIDLRGLRARDRVLGHAPLRADRSIHALTAAKRLRLPSILSERSAARNSSPESHAKKYPPE